MSLNEKPEVVTWPPTHYVYIEKVGPFQETAPQSWKELNDRAPAIAEQGTITGKMSLYRIDGARMTYRAGASLASAPVRVPDGLSYEKFQGGKYARFVLTGSYSQLGEASGRVFDIVRDTKLERRDDFCIENYVNDPKTTAEDQLITEILIPIA